MKTIKLTSSKTTVIARSTNTHDATDYGTCNYSGNDGYTAARRTVIEQIKSKLEDFDLVETNATGETLTTNYRGGVAVDQAWT